MIVVLLDLLVLLETVSDLLDELHSVLISLLRDLFFTLGIVQIHLLVTLLLDISDLGEFGPYFPRDFIVFVEVLVDHTSVLLVLLLSKKLLFLHLLELSLELLIL